FVYSTETGRVTPVNLSNCTKEVLGLTAFQVIQDEVDAIVVRCAGDQKLDEVQLRKFESALRARTGAAMRISFERVDTIPREKSGKFRIVKNNLSSAFEQ